MARRRRQHHGFGHWAAPTAFLAGATIAVVLVASALHDNGTTATTGRKRPTATRPAQTTPTTTRQRTATAQAGARYATVVAGDTFGTLAAKNGTTVAELERLNPGVSSTSLHIGQRIRVA